MSQSQPDDPLAEAEAVSAFYIPSLASARASRVRTLKHGDTFIVLDAHGDAQADGRPSAEGLFHMDTRFLSRLVLLINGERPLLLGSTGTAHNELLTADLARCCR